MPTVEDSSTDGRGGARGGRAPDRCRCCHLPLGSAFHRVITACPACTTAEAGHAPAEAAP